MDTERELFLAQQNYATLTSLANKLEKNIDRHTRGLTARQYMTVLAVFHLPPEETTLNNIAKKLGATKQNVNRLIAAVKQKGYITVSSDSSDKRAINVQLTDSGMQAMLENAKIGCAFLLDAFHGFSEDELETLWSLLKKLHRYDGEDYSGFEYDASERFIEKGE